MITLTSLYADIGQLAQEHFQKLARLEVKGLLAYNTQSITAGAGTKTITVANTTGLTEGTSVTFTGGGSAQNVVSFTATTITFASNTNSSATAATWGTITGSLNSVPHGLPNAPIAVILQPYSVDGASAVAAPTLDGSNGTFGGSGLTNKVAFDGTNVYLVTLANEISCFLDILY